LNKNSLLLLISLLFLFCCSTIPEFSDNDIENRENLALNPSFELGQYDPGLLPFGWFTIDNEKREIYWEENNSFSGNKSIKVSTGSEAVEIISESFPISPNNIYYLQCYLKSRISKNAQVTLAFIAFDKKGKKVSYYSEMIYPENDWTKLGFRTGFLDNKARYARLIVILPENSGTDFWVDDVKCFVAHKFTK